MSGISLSSRVEIVAGESEHVEGCLRIAESLPEHFNEAGLGQMRHSLSGDALHVAVEGGCVVGFATVGGEEEAAEITWIVVDPSQQGKGIGRALIKRIEEDLAEKGIETLTVKTLAEKADYPPYEATRRFYEQNGFTRVETVDSYPDWDGDPAVIYAKELPAQVGERVEKVNIEQKLRTFNEHWSPKIVGELNGQHVKLVKLLGEFDWHHHDAEDELFLVVRGRFRMEFRDRSEWIEEGEFIVVPRGVEHRPVAEEEAHVLLFEPDSTVNTGNADGELTAELERI